MCIEIGGEPGRVRWKAPFVNTMSGPNSALSSSITGAWPISSAAARLTHWGCSFDSVWRSPVAATHHLHVSELELQSADLAAVESARQHDEALDLEVSYTPTQGETKRSRSGRYSFNSRACHLRCEEKEAHRLGALVSERGPARWCQSSFPGGCGFSCSQPLSVRTFRIKVDLSLSEP